MNKINRFILILTVFCVLLTLSLSLAACATGSQQNYNTGTVRIKTFTSYNGADTAVDDMVNNWVEENSNNIVIVDIQYECAAAGTNYSTSTKYSVCVVYYLR